MPTVEPSTLAASGVSTHLVSIRAEQAFGPRPRRHALRAPRLRLAPGCAWLKTHPRSLELAREQLEGQRTVIIGIPRCRVSPRPLLELDQSQRLNEKQDKEADRVEAMQTSPGLPDLLRQHPIGVRRHSVLTVEHVIAELTRQLGCEHQITSSVRRPDAFDPTREQAAAAAMVFRELAEIAQAEEPKRERGARLEQPTSAFAHSSA